MNNSKLAIEAVSLSEESRPDIKPQLREKEATLIRVIEAIQRVEKSPEWRTLKIELFDGLLASLEKELREEAKKETPNVLKLRNLAGQLKWADRYANLSKLEADKRNELTGIRKNLAYESE